MRGKRRLVACWMLVLGLMVGCGRETATTGVTESETAETKEQGTEPESVPESEEIRTFELALVTDGRTLEFGQVNQTAWEGLETYAEEQGISHCYYRPAGTETADYAASIAQAVDNGARMVVCIGDGAQEAVLQMQKTYPRVKFVLVDGEPREEDGAVLSQNALAVRFRVDQAAYLMGYAVGSDPVEKVGFIGEEEDDNSRRYCYGFLQGLNEARSEKNSEGTDPSEIITLYTRYTDSDITSEEIRDILKNWSEQGVTVVFAGTEALSAVCGQKSQEFSLNMLSSEIGLADQYSNVLTAAAIDASSCVYDICQKYYEGDFKGGSLIFYDASTGSVGLDLKNMHFANFTPDTYKAMLEQIGNGEIQINDDIAVAIRTLNYSNVRVQEQQ